MTEKFKKGYILPIGSVVKLKKGQVLLSVIGRGQLFDGDEGRGYFDYSAVIYPIGIVSADQFLFFNEEDIEEIVFEGYRNAEEKEFEKKYPEEVANAKYPQLHLKDNE